MLSDRFAGFGRRGDWASKCALASIILNTSGQFCSPSKFLRSINFPSQTTIVTRFINYQSFAMKYQLFSLAALAACTGVASAIKYGK
jgi:hypothetical protein